METVTVKQLKGYLDMLPEDAEIILGMGKYESPLVDILKGISPNPNVVRFVNQTYLDDCEIIGKL